MTNSKSVILSLIILLFLIFCNIAFSQKLEPKKRTIEPDHIISSDIIGRDCQLYISFPLSYSTKDTITYPVLYVMDGERDFNFFYQENKYLGKNRKTQEVIIVGIGSGVDFKARVMNRELNFTPSPNLDSIRVKERAKKFDLPEESLISGRAAEILRTLKTEIIPFVDENYKTNTDRGITGHSLGGLFTAYCLLNPDGYFTRFGINSPSLW